MLCARAARSFIAPWDGHYLGIRTITSTASTMYEHTRRKINEKGSGKASYKPKPPNWVTPENDPRPSASVILISPTNQVLMLHRIPTGSFPSAHVFPGGNLDRFHDGGYAQPWDPHTRHSDGSAYRWAAIRETFEETGILLAVRGDGGWSGGEEGEDGEGGGGLVEVDRETLERGRRLVHEGEVPFPEWLRNKTSKVGGFADRKSLVPFTRWVTPESMPKRYSTQMYLYFLPLRSTVGGEESSSPLDEFTKGTVIPTPTHDGGIEHTEARFLPPSEWLEKARKEEIILYPPQFFLLSLIAPILSPKNQPETTDIVELAARRQQLIDLVTEGDPPWAKKVISPKILLKRRKARLPNGKEDVRNVLALDSPGKQLEHVGMKGDPERVILVEFRKGVPRRLEVAYKEDILEQEREARQQQDLSDEELAEEEQFGEEARRAERKGSAIKRAIDEEKNRTRSRLKTRSPSARGPSSGRPESKL